MSGLVEQSADARSKTIGGNFRVRAWVNFNGTGTVAIRGSGNVSSITDNGGTGDYTINFTTNMPDANYTITTIGTDSANYHSLIADNSATPSVGSFRVASRAGGTFAYNDTPYGMFTVIR